MEPKPTLKNQNYSMAYVLTILSYYGQFVL